MSLSCFRRPETDGYVMIGLHSIYLKVPSGNLIKIVLENNNVQE